MLLATCASAILIYKLSRFLYIVRLPRMPDKPVCGFLYLATGSCCERQWKLPRPQIKSVESSPITFLSLKQP